jgi:hypothetical protein
MDTLKFMLNEPYSQGVVQHSGRPAPAPGTVLHPPPTAGHAG